MVWMEKAGKPAAAIVSAGFEKDAAITGRVLGLPAVRFITVPDVLTGLPDEQVEREAEEAVNQAVEILTRPPKDTFGGLDLGVTGLEPAQAMSFNGTDYFEAWAHMGSGFLEAGFGDGIPLVPPTPQSVARMLKGTTLSPNHVVGVLPPGNGIATVEKIAINCVMAGCEPAHLPVVIAAIESVLSHAGTGYDMSTSCDAQLILVNGPIVKELGINSGRCTLGPGPQSKANIAIGRALRLVKVNIGFQRPGVMDMDTIGSPTKFSMCAGENEGANPWEPFHVEHGFTRDRNTVTVFEVRNVKETGDMYNTTPEGVLDTVAFLTSVVPEHYGYYGTHQHGYLILLSPEHASIIQRHGWSKESLRRYVWHRAVIPASRHTNQNQLRHEDVVGSHWKKFLKLPESEMEKVMLPVIETPDLYQIAVVGGPVGKTLTFSFTGAFRPVEIRHRAAV